MDFYSPFSDIMSIHKVCVKWFIYKNLWIISTLKYSRIRHYEQNKLWRRSLPELIYASLCFAMQLILIIQTKIQLLKFYKGSV